MDTGLVRIWEHGYVHPDVILDARTELPFFTCLFVGNFSEDRLGRTWRDAELYEIGAGTSKIRRMLIGRELFAETC